MRRQRVNAREKASWTQSSARSQSPVTLISPATIRSRSAVFRKGGDGPATEFYYDGKTMMAYAPAANLVDVDGQDDRCADDHLLPEGLDCFDDEAVLENGRNERADCATENRAYTAEETRPADNGCRNRDGLPDVFQCRLIVF